MFFTKQATLLRRSTVLSFPPQLVFPDQGHAQQPSKCKCSLLFSFLPLPQTEIIASKYIEIFLVKKTVCENKVQLVFYGKAS
jgi:hypothetical protein